MNEETNSFQVDVEAESQAISGFGSDDIPTPSEIINVMPDVSLAGDVTGKNSLEPVQSEILIQSEKIQYQETEKLIPSIPYEATSFDSSMNVNAEKTQTYGLNFNVKIDPEQVYEKTQILESQVASLQSGVETMVNEMNSSWIPNKNRDDFEERPLIEATNLIFENRRDNASLTPPWS